MSNVDFRFYLITDRHQCRGRKLTDVVQQACAAGVRAVQLREKDLSARHLFELAQNIRSITHATQTKLILNERFDIMLAGEADGVHLTSSGLSAGVVRKHVGEDRLIGISTHSLEEAQAAEQAGADFILFGPVFFTASKAKYGEPQGLKKLKNVADKTKIPVFAVGGIDPERARQCHQYGAWGVAAISSIMQASNIGSIVKQFEDALDRL